MLFRSLGCLEARATASDGKKLFNSAFVVQRGKIVQKIRKQLLPTYDVFDEKRWFAPGNESEVFEWQGIRFGITICEDIWHSEIREYQKDPVAGFFAEGRRIDCLINISASPFQRDKEATRHRLFQAICRTHSVPLLYANQVGGQDSLLFDGRSLVMDAKGEICAKAKGFEEDMLLVDTESWCGAMHGELQEDEVAAVHDALVMGINDYVCKSGFRSVVLGLSGGIDSALTAALAVRALGAENVLGVALPSPYSSNDSMEDAQGLALNMGFRFEEIGRAHV